MRFFFTGSFLLFLACWNMVQAQEIRSFDDFQAVALLTGGGKSVEVLDNDIYSGDVNLSILSYTNNTLMLSPPYVTGGNRINISGSLLSGSEIIVYQLCSVGPFPQCDTATLYVNVSLGGLLSPVAATDNYLVTSIAAFNGPVMQNDLSGLGGSLNAITVSPIHGSATKQDNRIVYTPEGPFEKDSLKYRICDLLSCSEAYVYYNYFPPNDPPALSDFTVQLNEDGQHDFQPEDFTERFNDPEGDALHHIRVESTPDNGVLYLEGIPVTSGDLLSADELISATYIPEPDFHGDDGFQWNAWDGRTYAASSAQCNLQVNSVNDPPVAQNDTLTIEEDQMAEINALANDFDKDGSITGIDLPDPIPNGSAVVQNLKIIFEPAPNFHGAVQFNYVIEDQQGRQDEATVFVTVNPVKDSITVRDFAVELEEDDIYIFSPADFGAHTEDPDELVSKIVVATLPSYGELRLNGVVLSGVSEIATGEVHLLSYAPDDDYFGNDYFEWTAAGETDIATPDAAVHITINAVNDPPVAVEDTLYINEDQVATLEIIAEDDEDEDLEISITVEPLYGSVEVDGRFITFTPNPDYNGITSFEYQVTDSEGLEDEAKIIVIISPIDDPVYVSGFSVETDEDNELLIPLQNFVSRIEDPDYEVDMIRIKAPPQWGVLKINDVTVGEGQNFRIGDINSIKFQPETDYFGQDKFQWTAGHDGYFALPATTNITIHPLPDPPQAVNDTIYGLEDKVIGVYPLLNDHDADGEGLEVVIKEAPEIGAAEADHDYIAYTPAPDFFGEVSFTYYAVDLHGLESAAEIVIFLEPVYDEPVISDFNKTLQEDHILTLSLEEFSEQISDPDGTVDHIAFKSLPKHGALTIDNSPVETEMQIDLSEDLRVSYKPDTNYFGSDELQWTAFSGENQHQTVARLTLKINSVNDPPIAVNDSGFVMNEEETIEIDVLQNDYDIENDPLKVIVMETPEAHLAVTDDQKIRVTPVKDFFGELVFSYKLDDHMPGYHIANVYVEVLNVNDPPVASDVAFSVKEDETLQFAASDFRENFSDADNDPMTGINITTRPDWGALQFLNKSFTGSFIPVDSIRYLSYKPEADFNGRDQFEWSVSAGDSTSLQTAKATIDVIQVPDEVVLYKGFSPNEDGFNQKWIIDGIWDYPDNKVQIFNRSGILIFEMENYDNETRVWSGETNRNHLNKEKVAPDDTYFYVLRFGSDKETLKGYIVLKR